SRIVLQEPVGVLQRTQGSMANGAASPRQNINRAQRSLRTNARSKAEPQMAATVAQERSPLSRRAEEVKQPDVPLDLQLADGHVEPAQRGGPAASALKIVCPGCDQSWLAPCPASRPGTHRVWQNQARPRRVPTVQ